MSLLNFLQEPTLRGIDLQGFERIAVHAQILAGKPLIKQVFKEFYDLCMSLDERYFAGVEGMRVELGAGTSLFKKYYPTVISSDLHPAEPLDMVIDAQAMDLKDQSVRTLFCINSFHHFPDPKVFFREVLRVVRPGGGCVIIDPYFGLVSRILYRHLFQSEAYDRVAAEWHYIKGSTQREQLPNQALSYLVFFRDRQKFQTLFPQLEIVHHSVIPSYVRYILSGGLNFRQLVPTIFTPLLRLSEILLLPLRNIVGLHHVVVLRKQQDPTSLKGLRRGRLEAGRFPYH